MKGQSTFRRKEMKQVSETTYEAKIPAAFVTATIEYFIEAFDENGNGPARFGDEDFPIEISIPDSGMEPASTGEESTEAWEPDSKDNTDPWLEADDSDELREQAAGDKAGYSELNAAATGQESQDAADESESTPVGLYAGVGVGVGAVVLVAAVVGVIATIAGVWLLWPAPTDEPPDEVKIKVGAPVPVNGFTNSGGRQ